MTLVWMSMLSLRNSTGYVEFAMMPPTRAAASMITSGLGVVDRVVGGLAIGQVELA